MPNVRTLRVATRLLLVVPLLAACGEGISTPPPGSTDPPAGNATPAGLVWMQWQPRAIDVAQPDSVTLTVALYGPGSAPRIVPLQGQPVTLRSIGGNRFAARVGADYVLRGHRAGDDHHMIGHLEGISQGRINLGINVRTSSAPDIPVRRLAEDAQISPHLLNLRYDELYLGGRVPPAVTRRVYELLPDSFDFLAVVEQVVTPSNRFYAGVRNQVRGIGLPLYDHGAGFGSAARLQGLVHYPIDGYFDLGEKAAIHEIGHRWINFLRPEGPLAPGSPHWPISTLAYGIMGFSIPGSGAGGDFPFRMEPDGAGNFVLRAAPVAQEFNSMELYLMGLAEPAEVERFVVIGQQDQATQLRDGGVLRGPATEVGVDEVLARFGPRVPGAAEAQKHFRIAAVVLSHGGLLDAREMAFFDYMAARGEARTELPYTTGFARGTSKPFFLATRGRATLQTRLPPPR